jgi:hypothetical protein
MDKKNKFGEVWVWVRKYRNGGEIGKWDRRRRWAVAWRRYSDAVVDLGGGF